MNDQEKNESANAARDWLIQHRNSYLSSGGAEGHLIDFSFVGGPALTTNCLVRCYGRKSGNVYITPLIYGVVNGEVVVIASFGGAKDHPKWYLNLIARDEVEFQIGTQAFRATWREAVGAERERVWNFMKETYPPYIDYEKLAAPRKIPILMMKAVESIPVFTNPKNS